MSRDPRTDDEAPLDEHAPPPEDEPTDDDPTPQEGEDGAGEGDDADNEEGPLFRQKGESAEQHRAFLLWAMQDPTKSKRHQGRSGRAVARALARDESSVRFWKRKHRWEDRATLIGDGAQTLAMRLYRERYLVSKGRIELDIVRPFLSVALYPDEPHPAPPDSQPHLPEATGNDPEAGKPKRGNKSQEATEAQLKKQILVFDAVVAAAARDIQNGKLRVTAKDLPFIFSARERAQRRLDEIEGGPSVAAGPVRIPESHRVRLARQTGGDVLQAMCDDAADLAITLRAIAGQQREDAEQQARLRSASSGASPLHVDGDGDDA